LAARRSADRPRIAIFVSKYDHCLQDLLYRHQSGELPCEIPLIVSNHPDNQRIADFYRVPYYVVPVTKENKREAEAAADRADSRTQVQSGGSGPLYAGALW
jgi:formyltetrahydrofolate deformylase